MPNPVALVSKKGQILFCNNQFEVMLKSRLGSNVMPSSIFKLVGEDQGSSAKLKTLIDEALKNTKEGGGIGGCAGPLDMTINQSSIIGSAGGTDKLPRVEVLLRKNTVKVKSPSPMYNKMSPGVRSSLEETRTNLDKNQVHKDIFESKNMFF